MHRNDNKTAFVPNGQNRETATPLTKEQVPMTPGSRVKIGRRLFEGPSTPETPRIPETPESRKKLRIDPSRIPINREPMKVYLRVRPLTTEEAEKNENCVSILNDTSITIRAPTNSIAYRAGETESKYQFTGVFGEQASQQEVFNKVAAPYIESFLKGGNSLIFAYGITNAGKTYTISGPKRNSGILPRTVDVIFNSIQGNHIAKAQQQTKPKPDESEFEVSSVSSFSSTEDDEETPRVPDETVIPVNPNSQYMVWMSYLEIYNEKVFDLLNDDIASGKREPLKLGDDNLGGASVKDLTEIFVRTPEEGHKLLEKGFKNRQVANTMLNQDSSRGHCIITFKLFEWPKDKTADDWKKNPPKPHKLSIIDLAGSERNNRTKTTGAQLKEAGKINSSLMTFGRCIEILRWNQQHADRPPKPIPFRDSKLTRLFQSYFVGNGKATMIVNISPSSVDYEETMNVLKFSAIAREVVTTTRLDTGRAAKPKGKEVEAILPPLESIENDELLNENVNEKDVDVQHMEIEKAELEAAIRDEVCAEMAQQMVEMEQTYNKRLARELQIQEEKFEKKMDIMNKMHTSQNTQTSADKQLSDQLVRKNKELMEDLHASKHVQEEQKVEIERLGKEVHRLEEELEEVRSAKDHEIAFLRQNLEEKSVQLENMCKELMTAVANGEADRREKEEMKAKVQELLNKLASTPKRSPFPSLREKSSTIVHAETTVPTDSISNMPLPKHTKVTTTPTKKELKKHKKYEIVDVSQPQSLNSSFDAVQTVYKGEIEKSVAGGVSVVFTDVQQHVVAESPMTSFSSMHQSFVTTPEKKTQRNSGSLSPPKIILTPPHENELSRTNSAQRVLYDPFQEEPVMKEEEDMDEVWQDIELDDDDKKNKKKKKEQKKLEKQYEKEIKKDNAKFEKIKKELEKQREREKEKEKQKEKEKEKEREKMEKKDKKFNWRFGKELVKKTKSSQNLQCEETLNNNNFEPIQAPPAAAAFVPAVIQPATQSVVPANSQRRQSAVKSLIAEESLDKENSPINSPRTSLAGEKKRKLFSGIDMLQEVTEDAKPKRSKPKKEASQLPPGKTPIAKRLRSRNHV